MMFDSTARLEPNAEFEPDSLDVTRLKTHALLIDDDPKLFELCQRFFGTHQVSIEHAPTGEHGLERLRGGGIDVVLLDIMMPGIDGLEVLKRLRASGERLPVIMLTARGDETDRIVGLELGADDYLPKPFNPRELLARMRAVLRRAHPNADGEQVRAGEIVLDLGSREARLGQETIGLTGLEFDLLAALAKRAGRVVPRERLLSLAGRDEHVGERTVDVHISKLRKKLGDDPKRPRLIKTVRGVGYVLAG